MDDIERQMWLVDNMLIMPKHEEWIKRDVRIERATGTTRIEGASLDEAAVRQLANDRRAGKPTEDELANLNALRAYEFIDFLSDQQDIPIDELVIRQLNRYFMDGALPILTPGAYRKGKTTVGNFDPPDQGDVPDLMRSLALWLRNEDDDMHPVLKAGIAHLHLVAIHPFWDGNGRTARGLSTLVLQRTGFGFKKLLSLEFHLSAIRDRYFAAIERALDTRFSESYDATSWLEFFVVAMKLHIDALVGRLTDWHRMMQDLHVSGSDAGLTPRQVDGHMYALHLGQITRSDYIEVTGVSPLTASRDLAKLVELGLLEAEGKTRSRVYRPTVTRQRAVEGESTEKQLALPE
ncbi:MAG: Fic family protein [Chloroflexi bacterium]|nr:Fic family protein [Chloroflexota bacterium]